LLRGVLRDEWGFDGVVISDWFGTHSAANSLEAGLDLEMPGPPRERGDILRRELEQGLTTEARLDESVRRLLRMFDWAGVFGDTDDETTDDSPATRDVIRRAAIAGMVLLKNDRGVLPLAADTQVALLGPNSDRGQIQGGGSAQVRPDHKVMPLGALQQRGALLRHEPGCRIEKRLAPMRGSFEARYSDLHGNTGTALHDRLSFLWMDDPAPGIDRRSFTAHFGGTFTPDVDGDWTISLTSVGPTVLRLDGEVLIDLGVPQTGGSYFGLGSPEIRVTVPCEAGIARQVEIELGEVERSQLRGMAVGAAAPANDDALHRAVAAAADAPVAVVVVGTNADWETEGEDRSTLALPGEQDELVRRVAAANPNTVVVVNAGSPVAMPWLDDVAAVLLVWFPGEEFGTALAEVLYGVAEPGGRLPVTFPQRIDDTPAFAHYPGAHDHMAYGEGLLIGHRWYDQHGIEPLFPFGYGLGYTTWSVEPASVEGDTSHGATVDVVVRNTGHRAGSTVVQVYVAPDELLPGRPVRTLQGFAKVALEAGEERTVQVALPARAFQRWDPTSGAWATVPGTHTLWVGESSRQLTPAGECRAAATG
jgi:beta-glucosidase